jgi:hypothetical protein
VLHVGQGTALCDATIGCSPQCLRHFVGRAAASAWLPFGAPAPAWAMNKGIGQTMMWTECPHRTRNLLQKRTVAAFKTAVYEGSTLPQCHLGECLPA